ncbi:MAG: hypothetical protein Q4F41_03035 [Eubacteriales bacterium]|nr:hypothetical protein [Eubacteriales bacterium]
MSRYKKVIAMLLSFSMLAGACTCSYAAEEETAGVADAERKAYIEETLNLANNAEQEWTYSADADAWVLSIVSAVAYPELPDQQGVSVCVPGAYVTGIDTDGDGTADVTAETYTDAVGGSLVIDYDAEVTSTNGQVYTAATAPVILNTGAAGYGSSTNTLAATTYASEGYINVACGNRGKQDTATDEYGNTYYTGDAPSCLVDQKNAARFVKYNILLGNLPGSVDYFVSTGGSGGGAHATMFAATSNNPDFYDYEIEAGAVGVYQLEDGSYTTAVTIGDTDYEISDGAWGCIAYSAITSLYEGDMAMAFEYYMDTDYEFGSAFQAQLAEYLSAAYMEYINEQNLAVEESAVGFDLNGDGDLEDTIALTIEYDPEAYPETNGYYGTYLDLYLAEFQSNLQWYLDNLDYAEGWTWFDTEGNALSDEDAAAMTSADKAAAFIEGRYAKGSSDGMGRGMMGGMLGGELPDGVKGDKIGGKMGGRMLDGGLADGEIPSLELTDGELPDGGIADLELTDGETSDTELPESEVSDGNLPDGDLSNGDLPEGQLPDGDLSNGDLPEGQLPDGDLADGELPDGDLPDAAEQGRSFENDAVAENSAGDTMDVGTPDAGTTQAAGSSLDSANYASYEEMVASYAEDIAEIEAGDKYGNNLVSLYNPLNYIGAEGTENPTWVRIMMGAAEGDMSMFTSLNLQIAMLNAGADANIEWQWDGGHVPSEILSESFSLYVDQMYGEYVNGNEIETPEAAAQTANGTAEEATGTDLSSWVEYSDVNNVSFTLADAVSYRTKGASKAIPGFDAIDYGQEDYVFGSSEKDARHWNSILLEIFETYTDVLSPLFNQGA